jgi:hypothetical protein
MPPETRIALDAANTGKPCRLTLVARGRAMPNAKASSESACTTQDAHVDLGENKAPYGSFQSYLETALLPDSTNGSMATSYRRFIRAA